MSSVWSICDDVATRSRLEKLSERITTSSSRILSDTIPKLILRLSDYLDDIKSNKENPFSDDQLEKLARQALTTGNDAEGPSKKRKISEAEHVNGVNGGAYSSAAVWIALSSSSHSLDRRDRALSRRPHSRLRGHRQ
jgi:hypothetical protein